MDNGKLKLIYIGMVLLLGAAFWGTPRGIYEAKDYGCFVNDSVDDTVCLQTMFNDATSDDIAGAILKIEAGQYDLGGTGDNLYIDWDASYTLVGPYGGTGNVNGAQFVWSTSTEYLDAVKYIDLATEPDGASCAGAPTVTITGGGGSGTTATALMGAVSTDVDKVVVEIANQGSGYTSAPTIDLNNNSCTGVDATAVMHTKKPVLRLIGSKDILIRNLTIQTNTKIATGISIETKTGRLTRSNVFKNVNVQGVGTNIEKGFVVIDGDQSAINYPAAAGPVGSGTDSNNDAHRFEDINCSNYTFACYSGEMSQALGIHIDLAISDATGDALDRTYDIALADGASGDFTGSGSYLTKLGPYAITTLHALGGSQPGNGGNVSKVTGGAWHRHIWDLAFNCNRATEVHGLDIEGSTRFLLLGGLSENSFPSPISVKGVNWTNSSSTAGRRVDPNGIINVGCAGPLDISGSLFQGQDNSDTTANSELKIVMHGKTAKIDFSNNAVRWRGNDGTAAADQDIFSGNIEASRTASNNHYRTNAGAWIKKDDERSNPNRIHSFGKTIPPTVTDDIDQSYVAGSFWIDATNNKLWYNEANTNGAAVWHNAGPGGQRTVTSKSTTYTALVTDDVIIATANTFTITLYTAVGNAGKVLDIKNNGVGTITIDGDGTETIDGALTQALSTQFENLTIVSDGANWSIL